MNEYLNKQQMAAKMRATGAINSEYFAKVLEAEPAADVAPVVHAQWVWNSEYSRTHNRMPRYNCSSCGMYLASASFHHCPNCGAKMGTEE